MRFVDLKKKSEGITIMRNIGLLVEPPILSCSDPKCPFHGTLSVRGQVFHGIVARDKMENAVIIKKQYKKYSHKYERFKKQTRNFSAHNPPCIDAKIGDIVIAAECRPLSKTISKVVIQKISHVKYLNSNPLQNLDIDKDFLINQLNLSITEIKKNLDSKNFKSYDLSTILNQLAICQKNLFYIKNDTLELKNAISNFKMALSNSEGNSSEKLELFNNLGISLNDLYYISGDLSILDEAIDIFEQALVDAKGKAPYFDILLTNLSDSKKERYSQLGSITDLEDAIDGYRKIIKMNLKKSPRKYTFVESLSYMLNDYSKRKHSYDYLKEAISLVKDALNLFSNDQTDKKLFELDLHEPSLWIDLGNLYRECYINFKLEISDSEMIQILDDAITAYRNAKQLLKNNPNNLSIALNNLANVQRDKYIQSNEIHLLKEAIMNWDESLKNIAVESNQFKIHSNNLAIGYLTLYEAERKEGDLKKSKNILESIRNSKERLLETIETLRSIIESENYDEVKDIDTQGGRIVCNVGEPTARKFVDCLPDITRDFIWDSVEQFHIYIICFKCSFNGSTKEGRFKVNFLNGHKPTVLDIFPKSVTEIRRDLKLGVHTKKGFEVKSDPKEIIFHQYDVLHPTIHGFTSPGISWTFKGKQLEDEQCMHLLIQLPKNIEVKNIMADLIAESGDKCTNSLNNKNLIEKII